MASSRILRSADIYCAVVDNFGDAGICWRLARMLAAEHGLAVRLWIDAPAVLARLVPALDQARHQQSVDGVEVHTWERAGGGSHTEDLPDLVVEAFGCGLTEAQITAMENAQRPPVWINLEYLSAEAWVDGYHGLPSPQPRHALVRHFFFPGFSNRTGGLLRERGLLARRDAFQPDAGTATTHLARLGARGFAPDALRISLFGYAQPELAGLLEAWAQGGRPIVCFVPAGGALAPAVDAWLEHAASPRAGAVLGRLQVVPVPFQSQDRYDELLWACDLNFVRGEDSFVRAQWAARPLVWQAYAQPAGAHHAKLEAFESRYLEGLDRRLAQPWHDFSIAWNGGRGAADRWLLLADALHGLRTHAGAWAARCADLPELGAALVRFAAERL